MDIKTFLINDKSLNKAEIAKLIWPDKNSPDLYLRQIISGERVFTQAEALNAVKVIHRLAQQYSKLHLEGHYPDTE